MEINNNGAYALVDTSNVENMSFMFADSGILDIDLSDKIISSFILVLHI